MKTTLEHALPIIRLLKYTGNFPFVIEKATAIDGIGREFIGLTLDNSWKYFVYQIIMFLYNFIRLIFGSHQLIINWLNPSAVDGNLSVVCILLTHVSVFVITLMFNWQKKKSLIS